MRQRDWIGNVEKKKLMKHIRTSRQLQNIKTVDMTHKTTYPKISNER